MTYNDELTQSIWDGLHEPEAFDTVHLLIMEYAIRERTGEIPLSRVEFLVKSAALVLLHVWPEDETVDWVTIAYEILSEISEINS